MMERIRKFAPKDDYQYTRNQASLKETKSFCTAVAPMCVILSYKHRDRGAQQWLDFWWYAVREFGYVQDKWNRMHTGIKCAVSYWNMHHPDDPLVYFNVKRNSEEFHESLNMWYRLVIWWALNRSYSVDYIEDGILNSPSSWKNKPSTYWHIRTVWKSGDRGIHSIDNYEWRLRNDYDIDDNLLNEIGRWRWSAWLYPSAYVITSGKVIGDDNSLSFEEKKVLQTLMQARSKLRELTDKADIKDQLHKENSRYRENYDL